MFFPSLSLKMPWADEAHDALTARPAMASPGEFFGSGELGIPVVRISVDGVGVPGLPMPAAQAQDLVRVATDAPYGRGPETIVDAARSTADKRTPG
jgi:hypothetical protein